MLQNAFREVVGLDLDDRLLPQTLHVRAFAFGGMSSGVVNLHHWRDRAGALARRACCAATPWSERPWNTATHVSASRTWRRPVTWDSVFALLIEHPHVLSANSWRPSGTRTSRRCSGGLVRRGRALVERLVGLGVVSHAARQHGRRPVDIAREHGHDHLLEALGPASIARGRCGCAGAAWPAPWGRHRGTHQAAARRPALPPAV